MKAKILSFAAVLLLLSLLAGCKTETKPSLRIATSTSLLANIVQQIGGSHVDVLNVVPPNQHPGNFDAKPGDIKKLTEARVFLLHGWPGEGYADKMIAAANNPNLTVKKIVVEGNWMIPNIQATATEAAMNTLIEIDAANAKDYQASAKAYQERIQLTETEIKDKLAQANAAGVKVIASARQADFLEWAGFDVVGTFQNAQTLTPQTIKELIDTGRLSGVRLVVNNLQDGADAGKPIAQELDIPGVNLSNFPGGFSGTETWVKAINFNVQQLLTALNTR